MNEFLRKMAAPAGDCPATGGDHQRGTTGEWAVRCVNCGQPY